jgi:hypothetical protein
MRWPGAWRYGGPWYGNDVQRVRFERGATRHFSTLRGVTRTFGPKAGRMYQVSMTVPHYELRHVEVFFSKRLPTLVAITADGPTDSPHRYNTHRLCIWYPDDPDEYRWVFEDGLLVLLGLIVAHLFREAWWRETGEWLGPEASHTPPAVAMRGQANNE